MYPGDKRIQALLAQLASGESTQIVSIVAQIDKILLETKHAHRQKVPPKMCGIHMSNRGGFGFSGAESMGLGSDVTTIGFTPSVCADACCFEDDELKSIEAFTKQLCNDDPEMATFADGEVRFGSVGCTNLNQFLCIALDALKCDDYENIVLDGRISRAKLEESSPFYKTALDEGIDWLVYHKDVPILYPEFPDIVQQARNATGNIRIGDSVFQVVTSAQSKIESLLKAKKNVGDHVQAIIDAIVRSKPKCSKDVPAIVAWTRKYGGGTFGVHAKELFGWSRVYFKTNRAVPGFTFESVVNWKLSPEELCPIVASGVIKVQATSPDNKVVNGVCKFVTIGDITKLDGTKKPQLLECEKLLRTCRDLIDRSIIDKRAQTRLRHWVETRMVRYLLEKPLPEEYSGLADIAYSFVEDVLYATPKVVKLSNPFTMPSGRKAPLRDVDSTPNHERAGVIEYNENGEAIGAFAQNVRSHGFVEDKVVENGEGCDRIVSKIMNVMDSGSVQLRDYSRVGALSPKVRTVEYTIFMAQYKLSTITFESVITWPAKRAEETPELANLVFKSKVIVAVEALAGRYTLPNIRIQEKPTKGVFATDVCAKESVTLIPISRKVIVYSEAIKVPDTAAKFTDTVAALPDSTKDFVVPYWHVGTTPLADKATAGIVHKLISVQAYMAPKMASSTCSKISVPCIVNTKRLCIGDELLLFKPAAEPARKVAKRHIAISELDTPSPKRASRAPNTL